MSNLLYEIKNLQIKSTPKSGAIKILNNINFNIKRGEKEIATAIQNMIGDNKSSMIVYPLCEHVPDLTFKEDIDKISQFLN